MRCPYCTADDDRVVDSRPAEGGAAIRRRRECGSCGQRYSTYERTEQVALSVRKRSGAIEPYRRGKVLAGIAKATNLAPEAKDVVRATAQVEASVRSLGRRVVDSDLVGAAVLAALRDLDAVAYVRFASVYKGFTSADDFRTELAALEAAPGGDDPELPPR